jgi:hypothetical protein
MGTTTKYMALSEDIMTRILEISIKKPALKKNPALRTIKTPTFCNQNANILIKRLLFNLKK